MCITVWRLKMWSLVQPVLSKVSFLFYWPFIYLLLPICLISSLTVMYSSLWLCATFLFYIFMMWWTLPSLLFSHFRSMASHFSSLISVCSFFFCSLLALPTSLSVFSILLLPLNTVHTSVYISYYTPPSFIHATTLHHPLFSSFFFLCLQHWLTELEIFAMIFAAAVHDYEHTGTTNNFHIQTR